MLKQIFTIAIAVMLGIGAASGAGEIIAYLRSEEVADAVSNAKRQYDHEKWMRDFDRQVAEEDAAIARQEAARAKGGAQ